MLRIAIYFSGVTCFLLLLFGLLGVMMEFDINKLYLIIGVGLLLVIFLSLIITERYLHSKKIKSILDSPMEREKKNSHPEGDSKTKGWGINNSPFRERRSGLTWGGGNVKGANATRGKRKTFLR